MSAMVFLNIAIADKIRSYKSEIEDLDMRKTS